MSEIAGRTPSPSVTDRRLSLLIVVDAITVRNPPETDSVAFARVVLHTVDDLAEQARSGTAFDAVLFDVAVWPDSGTLGLAPLCEKLPQHAVVLLALHPEAEAWETPPLAAWGLECDGVTVFAGRLCVRFVPTAGGDGVPSASLVAEVRRAARMAYVQGEAAGRERAVAASRVELGRQMETRERSEQVLLDHLSTVVGQLDDLRRQYRGRALVRTLAGRSILGRIVRRARRTLR